MQQTKIKYFSSQNKNFNGFNGCFATNYNDIVRQLNKKLKI